MKLKHVFAATAIVLATTAPGGAATLFGTNYGAPDDFFQINTSTGQATGSGATGNPDVGDLTSDTRAGSARIFGIDLSAGGPNDLLQIDTGTGVASVLSTITGAVGRITSIAFDTVSGVLYGNTTLGFGGGSDRLYTIDVGTGVATEIGAIGFDNVFALAFDMAGGLYGVSDRTNELLSIDTGSGIGSLIGSTGLNTVFDLAMDPDSGIMYASDAFSTDSLYTIDLGTGATTLVGGFNNPNATNIAGLAFDVAAVPLPGALPLFFAGLGALGLIGRRRRKVA